MIKRGYLLVAVVAGLGLGFQLGTRRDLASYLALETVPPLDYYSSQASFSEVENTKASLAGLCQRFRTEVREKRVADHLSPAGSRVEPGAEVHLDDAIAALERGVNEFAGTTQQIDLAQDLLLALKKSKQFNRWIDVYLTALYKQPTHPVVGSLAKEALNMAGNCGREREVLAGLRHIEEIPVDFEGKAEVQTALRQHEGSLATNERLSSP